MDIPKRRAKSREHETEPSGAREDFPDAQPREAIPLGACGVVRCVDTCEGSLLYLPLDARQIELKGGVRYEAIPPEAAVVRAGDHRAGDHYRRGGQRRGRDNHLHPGRRSVPLRPPVGDSPHHVRPGDDPGNVRAHGRGHAEGPWGTYPRELRCQVDHVRSGRAADRQPRDNSS